MGEGEIKLVTDKKTYRPGETAEVLALLPTDKAHLLVTTELRGVMSVQRIDAVGRTAFIRVPIEKTHAPNIFLSVTYVRGSDMYAQNVELVVPARDKLLKLDIIPNKKEYRPRETASYTVLARNADGTPAAGAEVSLGVVDESIYSIAPESVGDIRRTFYDRRYNQVQTSFSVNYYFIGYAGKKVINLAAKSKRRQFADTKNEGETVNPLIRKIFKDTAFWQPALVTGPDGKATAKFELPDNLTTWRATARAVTADTRVGTAVSRVVERKDVIVRVALPRFLTAGDTVTLSGIAHNYLKQEKVTKITIDVQGARLLDSPEQTVSIPSFGEHRVNWRVTAPATGELKVLVKALTDAESDAVEIGIPVVPRGLKVTRAESAVFSEDEAEKTFHLQPPGERRPEHARVQGRGHAHGRRLALRRARLPDGLPLRLRRADDVALPADGHRLADLAERRERDRQRHERHRSQSEARPAPPLQLPASGRRLGLVEGRRDRPVHDGLRRGRAHAGAARGLRGGRGPARDAGARSCKALLGAGRNRRRQARSTRRRAAYMIYSLDASGEADARYLDEMFAGRGKLRPLRSRAARARAEGARRREARARGRRRDRAHGQANAAEAHWKSRRRPMLDFTEENDVEATALSVKALARIAPQSELLPKAARWLVRSRKYGHYWQSTQARRPSPSSASPTI